MCTGHLTFFGPIALIQTRHVLHHLLSSNVVSLLLSLFVAAVFISLRDYLVNYT